MSGIQFRNDAKAHVPLRDARRRQLQQTTFDGEFDAPRTAVYVFAEHGDRAVQIAAMRANNCAHENDTPGFRHWAQVVTELNAMILVAAKSSRPLAPAKKPRKSKAKAALSPG